MPQPLVNTVYNQACMVAWIFIVWLGVLPFVAFSSSFEWGKMQWFLVGCIGIVLYWITHIKDLLPLRRADIAYLIWVFVLFVSSVLGVHPLESIVGRGFRYQGVLFFFALWL